MNKYHPYYQRFKSFEDRFWEKVSVGSDDECWNWKAGLTRGGYGQFSNKVMSNRAHRIAWHLSCGPIPTELFVLHKCDNPKCVNPNHLYLGSHGDNMNDRSVRNRCNQKGERNAGAKLNDNIVRDIFALREEGHTHKYISDKTNIRRTHVTKILNKQIWSHVK